MLNKLLTHLRFKSKIDFIFACLITAITSGCSYTEDPQNLEPEIALLEATDITRTEATLNATIIKHGVTDISFVYFNYGNNGDMNQQSEIISSPDQNVSIRISDLKPGSEYHFMAKGGRDNAVFTSSELSFTTIPNSVPSINTPELLSSGPIAIIVGFEIEEEGGEPIIDSGCYITNLTTNTTIKKSVESEFLNIGKYQLLFNNLSPDSDYSITAFASNSVGEIKSESIDFHTENTVNLTSAGDLATLLGNDVFLATSLSISGLMNGDDFHYLRRLLKAPELQGETTLNSNLSSIDISDVMIVEGGGSYDGSRYTVANNVSTDLFSNCNNLKEINLPFYAKEIGKNAFANCQNLKSITVPPSVSSILPSSGCVALESVLVSDANNYYKSIDGVLLNYDATEILWFPQGKSGKYTVPESINEIKENAFRGTKITSLILHDNIKNIARGAFSDSQLTEIYLPEILTNISEGLFQDCKSLKILHLGSYTEFIGDYVFDGCPLENIYLKAVYPPYVSKDAFTNIKSLFNTCILHVPKGSKAIYRNHKQWGNFEQIVEL